MVWRLLALWCGAATAAAALVFMLVLVSVMLWVAMLLADARPCACASHLVTLCISLPSFCTHVRQGLIRPPQRHTLNDDLRHSTGPPALCCFGLPGQLPKPSSLRPQPALVCHTFAPTLLLK